MAPFLEARRGEERGKVRVVSEAMGGSKGAEKAGGGEDWCYQFGNKVKICPSWILGQVFRVLLQLNHFLASRLRPFEILLQEWSVSGGIAAPLVWFIQFMCAVIANVSFIAYLTNYNPGLNLKDCVFFW